MKKIKQKNMIKLFGFKTRNTLVDWEKEPSKRPIIKLIYQYFSGEDIEQFLEQGKISRLEYYEECKNVTDFIIKEVFDDCQEKRQIPEIQEFGKFLESIQDQRLRKTWIHFAEFFKNEEKIWNFFEKEFAQYLIKNELLIKSHLDIISNIYFHYPISHRYYFVKNFMWIFMPTIQDKHASEIKKIYNSLPSYVQKTPGVKLMIQVLGHYGFLGLLPPKFRI